MQKEMNAKEAREKALKVNTDEATGQYAQAKLIINEAAKEGKYKVFVYEFLKKDVVNQLETEGFVVTNNPGRYNETFIQISW